MLLVLHGFIKIGFCLFDPGLKFGTIELGKDLIFGHGLSFLRKHGLDAAGDLKGQVGLRCFNGAVIVELTLLRLLLSEIDKETDADEEGEKDTDQDPFFHGHSSGSYFFE